MFAIRKLYLSQARQISDQSKINASSDSETDAALRLAHDIAVQSWTDISSPYGLHKKSVSLCILLPVLYELSAVVSVGKMYSCQCGNKV